MDNKPAFLQDIERLVLFDGVCNLCNRNMLFLIRHDKHQRLLFCSVQSLAGQHILGWLGLPLDIHDSMLLLEQNNVYEKSDAVLRILFHLPWYWRWFYGATILPRFVRDNLYLLVARNRYRFLGRSQVCTMPSPEVNSRFISLSQ